MPGLIVTLVIMEYQVENWGKFPVWVCNKRFCSKGSAWIQKEFPNSFIMHWTPQELKGLKTIKFLPKCSEDALSPRVTKLWGLPLLKKGHLVWSKKNKIFHADSVGIWKKKEEGEGRGVLISKIEANGSQWCFHQRSSLKSQGRAFLANHCILTCSIVSGAALGSQMTKTKQDVFPEGISQQGQSDSFWSFTHLRTVFIRVIGRSQRSWMY